MRRFAATLLLTTPFLIACAGDTPKTQAELLVGEWDQVAPVTINEGGQTITLSDGEVEYKHDGTSEGETMMTISGMPEALASYRLDANGTYRLDGDVIISQITSVDVDPVGSDEQARQMASQMATMMAAGPESRSTILSIDTDTLVLRDEASGGEIRYTRD
ncbi:hypothetical protein ACFFUB_00110 [Algimonas porphyrae]|uniref:META domain-containing protein n=1 Tax=Algimonas porphyrae TaxID=1128113 RepID=A0ABQ5UYR3_9PROT|nr:hypothetical protein [Algimonas porphyrae]GLQ20433.1 hypothetical protein GCM10007854_13880 [Algimonas porphyrae]